MLGPHAERFDGGDTRRYIEPRDAARRESTVRRGDDDVQIGSVTVRRLHRRELCRVNELVASDENTGLCPRANGRSAGRTRAAIARRRGHPRVTRCARHNPQEARPRRPAPSSPIGRRDRRGSRALLVPGAAERLEQYEVAVGYLDRVAGGWREHLVDLVGAGSEHDGVVGLPPHEALTDEAHIEPVGIGEHRPRDLSRVPAPTGSPSRRAMWHICRSSPVRIPITAPTVRRHSTAHPRFTSR